GFERILPGPQRMYPDTDLPPKKITDERKLRIKQNLPKYFWERESWYNSIGVPADIIKDLSVSKYAKTFEILVEEMGISPVLAANALINFPKRLKKKGKDISFLNSNTFIQVFEFFKNKLICKDGIFYLLELIVSNNGIFEKEFIPQHCSQSELLYEIRQASKKVEKMKLYDEKNNITLTLSLVMKNLFGRIDGCIVAKEVINYFAKETENEQ
ncbi:MAG TPA: hypothetical protein PK498_08115, partial [Candidatus Kapabacteria bacterium]|nr:hypothetical protein [Candidatus Kapabacteria bacterium]